MLGGVGSDDEQKDGFFTFEADKEVKLYYSIIIFQMEIGQCPEVRPSEEEFSHFYDYIHRLEETYSKDYGMVKIVPPAGWKPQAKDYQKRLENLSVRHPIEQNVQGKAGFYESKNIVQPKMTLKAYRRYAEKESQKVAHLDTSEKERTFWKTITYSPPLYGADLTASLMDASAGSWDMNSLDSILKHALTERVKGVTEPYCYIGCWKAFFSWHKEDLDLGALNYIHEGASKFWYAISPDNAHILEEESREFFKAQARHCPQFLRHKTFLINPQTLLEKHKDLKITKTEHKAGEIMMVFGGAYHEGFNLGFNIAEAVNYGTKDWLRLLPDIKFCKCFKKCVRGQVESILYNLEHSSIYPSISSLPSFQQLQLHILENQLNEQEDYGIVNSEGNGLVEEMSPSGKKDKAVPKIMEKKEQKKLKTKASSSLKIKKPKKESKAKKTMKKPKKQPKNHPKKEEVVSSGVEEEKENHDIENQPNPVYQTHEMDVID